MEIIPFETFEAFMQHSRDIVEKRLCEAKAIFIKHFLPENCDHEEECRKASATIAHIAQNLTTDFIGAITIKILHEHLEKINDTLSVDLNGQLKDINENLSSISSEIGEKK